MNDFEKLVISIMKDAEKDGEPVTREEAEEMARMEIGAKGIKNYTQGEVEKKKAVKERKVDEEKKNLLTILRNALAESGIEATMENEVKLHFVFNETKYSVTLTKHRK